MHFKRFLRLDQLLEHRSVFLLGPRQTGKTTYLMDHFPTGRRFDLLDAQTFRLFSSRPETLRESIEEGDSLVIVDEIQRLPQLLNEVQLILDKRKRNLRFVLTGSSARKLKRGGANLLGGRALLTHLHPLVSPELGTGLAFDFQKRLLIGSLPHVIQSPIPHEDLKAYIGTYLQEEIKAEGLTRNIEDFSRFLEVAALTNGQLLNFTAIGSDCGVAPRTVQNFYSILEDTLVGFQLLPFRKTKSRKAISTAKFYFFDLGIVNALLDRTSLSPKTAEYGLLLEHLIFLELKAYLDYQRLPQKIHFWRSQSQLEVDFLVHENIAIEVKTKESPSDNDFKGLRALAEDIKLKRKIFLCKTPHRRKTADGIEIMPVRVFLEQLWSGDLF